MLIMWMDMEMTWPGNAPASRQTATGIRRLRWATQFIQKPRLALCFSSRVAESPGDFAHVYEKRNLGSC